MRHIGRVIALVVAGLAMAAATGWGALVLFYLAPGPSWMRCALAWSAVVLGLVALAALAVRRARWPRPRTRHPTFPGGSGPICRETL